MRIVNFLLWTYTLTGDSSHMSGKNNSTVVPERLQSPPERSSAQWIDSRGTFVDQNNLRTSKEPDSQLQLPLLTSRKRTGACVDLGSKIAIPQQLFQILVALG